MKIKKKRILSLIIFFVIVFYGVLKYRFLTPYSEFVLATIDGLGFDSNYLIELLNRYAGKKELKTNIMGWFIYYPTYIGLHILFIFVVFSENKKLRNIFLYGFLGLIGTLILTSTSAKLMEWQVLYRISYNMFRNIIGLPFVLLFIEGGQILYSDIKKKLEEASKNDI